MKLAFTLIIFLLIGYSTYSQKTLIRGHEFLLIGKINNKVNRTPDCGQLAFAIIIEFEVIKIYELPYSNKSIEIIVPCPESYGKDFFVIGKTYKVVFSDQNQANFEWGIFDKDLLKKNKLSFHPYAVSIKKL